MSPAAATTSILLKMRDQEVELAKAEIFRLQAENADLREKALRLAKIVQKRLEERTRAYEELKTYWRWVPLFYPPVEMVARHQIGIHNPEWDDEKVEAQAKQYTKDWAVVRSFVKEPWDYHLVYYPDWEPRSHRLWV